MLRDITIGQYFPGHSVLHKLDPRVKILLTLAYIVLLFFVQSYLGFAVSIIFLGICYAVARIPLKMILKSLKPIIPILIFTGILNMLDEGGFARAGVADHPDDFPALDLQIDMVDRDLLEGGSHRIPVGEVFNFYHQVLSFPSEASPFVKRPLMAS